MNIVLFRIHDLQTYGKNKKLKSNMYMLIVFLIFGIDII